jgi:hypothetical protein
MHDFEAANARAIRRIYFMTSKLDCVRLFVRVFELGI